MKKAETQLTVEEVNEKFKDFLLQFAHYYKYTFTFIGYSEDGEYKVTCQYGGDTHSIYRYDVHSGVNVKFNSIEDWNWIRIEFKGEEVFNFENWY